MGIVFGRSKNEVRVLNGGIHETQSLPVIKDHDLRTLSVSSPNFCLFIVSKASLLNE